MKIVWFVLAAVLMVAAAVFAHQQTEQANAAAGNIKRSFDDETERLRLEAAHKQTENDRLWAEQPR